ncbi:MAG: T4 RnlA family RNA ligase [Burkholderiales bacterium]|nr:T4 RnlA family RNA ligase [Anaerolineae bacterium]
MYQPDIQRIRRLVREGWISEHEHPDGGLFIFNYTQKAQYENVWTSDTLNCRGLILTADGTIVARSMRKFFNYGQWLPMPGTHIVSVAEKVDGSLGILFQHKDEYHITTRGSFVSDQAQWATDWFRQNAINPEGLDDSLTYMFEIIYPENRVVVDYQGQSGLWLIGARSKQFGHELYEAELDAVAEAHGFFRPTVYRMDNIEDILAAAMAMTSHEEGFVVRYSDNERVKVKSDAYKLAHRIMTGATFNRVLEAVRAGQLESMIEGVPDEFLGQVKAWKAEIEQKVAEITAECARAMSIAPTDNRKEFALWVQSNYPPSMHGYLYAYGQGKDINDLIYKTAFVNRQAADAPISEDEF